jgi:hypothetical protein
MYIREAHPTDGRQAPANIRDNILIADPKTLFERQKVAREFDAQFKVSVPILVDSLDDVVGTVYAGWPDRLYVIDAEGKIAYRGGPGPSGFRVGEAVPVLTRLTGLVPVAPLPPDHRTAPSDLSQPMRERLMGMLERMGLEEKARETVLLHLGKRMEAYRSVQEARRALMNLGNASEEEITRALDAYQEAQKKYTAAVEKLDNELDSAIGYRKKPRLNAALVGMGVLGVAPAAPFGPMSEPPRDPRP